MSCQVRRWHAGTGMAAQPSTPATGSSHSGSSHDGQVAVPVGYGSPSANPGQTKLLVETLDSTKWGDQRRRPRHQSPRARMTVTHPTLSQDIATLQPDDDFVNQLAQLAAASRPTRATLIPAEFSGPATRAVAIAAAVTAITAGAAAAATHLGESHHTAPAHPSGPAGIHEPPERTTHSHTPTNRPTPTPAHPTAHTVNHSSPQTPAPAPPATNTQPPILALPPTSDGPRHHDGTDTQGDTSHDDGNQDGSQDGGDQPDGGDNNPGEGQSGDGPQSSGPSDTGSGSTGDSQGPDSGSPASKNAAPGTGSPSDPSRHAPTGPYAPTGHAD